MIWVVRQKILHNLNSVTWCAKLKLLSVFSLAYILVGKMLTDNFAVHFFLYEIQLVQDYF